MYKSDVLQCRFPVTEPTGKRDEPKSKFTVEEMVNQALEGNKSVNPRKIWVSNRDATEKFVTLCGVTAEPKNGVPRGQVWLFVEGAI